MKCKRIVSFVCVVCAILCLCSCQKTNMYLNKEESFFSDFKVEDGKVYVYCSLVIENSTGAEKSIALTAVFENDVKNGLLTETVIDGYSIDENTNVFRLQKGKNQLEVVFIGQHGGAYQKHDRTLPDIKIAEAE